jgi:RNA polymerase sigma factor (sigma-70 family)
MGQPADLADPHRPDDCLRPELVLERRHWSSLDRSSKREMLHGVLTLTHMVSLELLAHAARLAFQGNDKEMLNLAFAALSKASAPLLYKQAAPQDPDSRKAQAQEVLTHIFESIKSGKSGYVEANFASFTLRKAISLHRSRETRLEQMLDLAEPTEEHDPLDSIPAQRPSPELQALLRHALFKLPARHRSVLVQYYLVQLTHREIANHYSVNESTIRDWLSQAMISLRGSGGNDE